MPKAGETARWYRWVFPTVGDLWDLGIVWYRMPTDDRLDYFN